jgi:hypothetical protein
MGWKNLLKNQLAVMLMVQVVTSSHTYLLLLG